MMSKFLEKASNSAKAKKPICDPETENCRRYQLKPHVLHTASITVETLTFSCNMLDSYVCSELNIIQQKQQTILGQLVRTNAPRYWYQADQVILQHRLQRNWVIKVKLKQ